MRWIKILTPVILVLWWACEELPPEEYDNPIDDEETEYDLPALVFFPDSVAVSLGTGTTVQVFAMGLEDLSGAHIQLEYDPNRLTLLSMSVGDFFASAEEITFFTDHNETTGLIDIYTSYLGGDSISVDGTGSLAYLVFTTSMSGSSTLEYTPECELVDPENTPITVNGWGKGVIYAK